MTERITITLPDGLVDELDGIAHARGLSRSAVIREASARYVTQEKAGDEAARRRKAGEEFLAFIDELQKQPVLDDRPTLEILREARETSGEAGR
ncbi:MAG: ribbon-helix-helix protein, CopG family [Actinobacteria bacterium]|nr:MAG: ribbon-helix-helix protein, CopG family [Actinomycetota bacterium]